MKTQTMRGGIVSHIQWTRHIGIVAFACVIACSACAPAREASSMMTGFRPSRRFGRMALRPRRLRLCRILPRRPRILPQRHRQVRNPLRSRLHNRSPDPHPSGLLVARSRESANRLGRVACSRRRSPGSLKIDPLRAGRNLPRRCWMKCPRPLTTRPTNTCCLVERSKHRRMPGLWICAFELRIRWHRRRNDRFGFRVAL
jgi:hypothetical protein